jgi:hypothetical protein
MVCMGWNLCRPGETCAGPELGTPPGNSSTPPLPTASPLLGVVVTFVRRNAPVGPATRGRCDACAAKRPLPRTSKAQRIGAPRSAIHEVRPIRREPPETYGLKRRSNDSSGAVLMAFDDLRHSLPHSHSPAWLLASVWRPPNAPKPQPLPKLIWSSNGTGRRCRSSVRRALSRPPCIPREISRSWIPNGRTYSATICSRAEVPTSVLIASLAKLTRRGSRLQGAYFVIACGGKASRLPSPQHVGARSDVR